MSDLTELALYDAGIQDLSEVAAAGVALAQLRRLQTLSLHHNRLTRMAPGLTPLGGTLQHLDLSSNQLHAIEGLGALPQLVTLNLASNRLTDLSGLSSSLTQLQVLNVSHNRIVSLAGLHNLHGPRFALRRLELQGNAVASAGELMALGGCVHLRAVTFATAAAANPVCGVRDYRSRVFVALPSLLALDGRTVHGQAVQPDDSVLGLGAHYARYAERPPTSGHEEVTTPPLPPPPAAEREACDAVDGVTAPSKPALETPSIDAALRQHRLRMGAQRQVSGTPPAVPAKADLRMKAVERQLLALAHQVRVDTSHRSSVETLDGSQSDEEVRGTRDDVNHAGNDPRAVPGGLQQDAPAGWLPPPTRIPGPAARPALQSCSADDVPACANDDLGFVPPPPVALPEGGGEDPSCLPPRAAAHGGRLPAEEGGPVPAVETQLGRELVGERARRLEAEDVVRQLVQEMTAAQERNRQHGQKVQATVRTIGKLERALTDAADRIASMSREADEYERRCAASDDEIRRLEAEIDARNARLTQASDRQTKLETANAGLQSRVDDLSAARQEAVQAAEVRLAAAVAETGVYRESLAHSKQQVAQLQELLAVREAEHQRSAAGLVSLDGPEVAARVRQACEREEAGWSKRAQAADEQLAERVRAYAELEEEFRRALRIEAGRYRQVQEAHAQLATEAASLRQAASDASDREAFVARTVTELTSLVKDQRSRLADAQSEQASLRAAAERAQALAVRSTAAAEALEGRVAEAQRERDALRDKVLAQESVIQGLRNERGLWSKELAAQGASLASDRGRLEHAAEAATRELAQLRESLASAEDTVRIKEKMLEDQGDTLRKLKHAVAEHGRGDVRAREEFQRKYGDLEDRYEAERALSQQLQEDLEKTHAKKVAARAEAERLAAELERAQREAGGLKKNWHDTGVRLGQVEAQVEAMRRTYAEKDAAARKRCEAAEEALRRVEQALRTQTEASQAAIASKDERVRLLSEELEAALGRATGERAKAQAVEAEMRALLVEQERERRAKGVKAERLRAVLAQLQDDEYA